MAKSEKIKSITYMKTHAPDILSEVCESKRPFIITHNGEGKMVIQDLESYEEMKDSIAMLKLVAQGRHSVEHGHTKPARKTFDSIERRRRQRDS